MHSRAWCTTVVVMAWTSCVVEEAIIVEVNLLNALLQHGNHVIEAAETLVTFSAAVGLGNRNDGIVAKSGSAPSSRTLIVWELTPRIGFVWSGSWLGK
jgi:hypothetical protein